MKDKEGERKMEDKKIEEGRNLQLLKMSSPPWIHLLRSATVLVRCHFVFLGQ